MFVSTRAKSITRSTILYAFRKVKEMERVPGPKAIGVHGDSYIYAIFKALGVIKLPLLDKGDCAGNTGIRTEGKM